MTAPDPIKEELAALQTFFADARARLQTGAIVSMEDMEQRIAKLCTSVTTSPPDQQKVYLPELTALIDTMNLYENALRTSQAAQPSSSSQS